MSELLALVASYFGQVIGRYFFWNAATLEKFLVGVQCPPDDRMWLGSTEVGQPKPKSESYSRQCRVGEFLARCRLQAKSI